MLVLIFITSTIENLMKQRYIVLGGAPGSTGGPDDILFESRSTGQAPTIPLSTADLDDDEAQEHIRNRVPIASPDVPLALITPTESSTADLAAIPWGLDAVGALTSPRSGKGVRVAVLDTGIDLQHAAFAALRAQHRIVVKNFTNGDEDDVTDMVGHGTHCAGTIAGGPVGGQRIGVAPDIETLLVGKVLGPGGGTNKTLTDAIQWATLQGAHIVSMSLAIDFPNLVKRWIADGMPELAATSTALKEYRETVNLFRKLADFLSTQNVLLVAATGNEANRPRYTIDVAPPAASDHIIKVGAVGRALGGAHPVARFSNTGPDLVAPGVDIVSACLNGGVCALNGTSMATPHVAGVAALWHEHLRARQGEVLYDDLKAEILGGAQAIHGARVDFGRGLVRAPQK